MITSSKPSRFRLLVASALALSLPVTVLALNANPASAATKAKTKAPKSALPALSVTDIKTGKPLILTSLANPKLPTLVWFWAPH
jgi:hypothetical protein